MLRDHRDLNGTADGIGPWHKALVFDGEIDKKLTQVDGVLYRHRGLDQRRGYLRAHDIERLRDLCGRDAKVLLEYRSQTAAEAPTISRWTASG